MATHVALLRAVNLGGIKRLVMADLRRFLVALGFESVRTLLQSGNRESSRASSKRARSGLELETDFFVRSAVEWATLVRNGPELARAVGKQVYVVYPDGQARSRFTTNAIGKTLGTLCTARGWNTVMKLAAAIHEERN